LGGAASPIESRGESSASAATPLLVRSWLVREKRSESAVPSAAAGCPWRWLPAKRAAPSIAPARTTRPGVRRRRRAGGSHAPSGSARTAAAVRHSASHPASEVDTRALLWLTGG